MEIPFERSFASHEKAKYWSDKNLIKPNKVALKSNNKYWFDCNICFHNFNITLNDVSHGYWCGYCGNKKLCNNNECNYCYNKSFASCNKSIYWSKKNELTPRDVYKSSGKKYIFDCECNHEIELRLDGITINNHWCSYCTNQKLCENKECKSCFEKSFASQKKAIYWSNKNKIIPREVFKSSNIKYIFDCNCGHEFEIRLANISQNYNWCQYCCIPIKKLCSNNDCNMCFKNSFASHKKSNEFSKKNKEIPRNIFKNSQLRYIFDCNICKHEYNAILGNSSWCPYCAIPSRILCKNNNCIFCFERSFASHEKSKYWSNKNIKLPREIFKGTDVKYWLYCDKCKIDFKTSPDKIIVGRWCSLCKTKTESKLNQSLKISYPSLKHQFKVDWCKNKTHLPFDFCIPELKMIVELDGAQHFKQVSNWQSPEKTNKIDLYKMKCANENGYSIIRILQEDVFNDKYDWLPELILNIKKIESEKKVQNIFMCKNDEYKIFNNIDYKLINEEELPDDIEDTETNDNIMKID